MTEKELGGREMIIKVDVSVSDPGVSQDVTIEITKEDLEILACEKAKEEYACTKLYPIRVYMEVEE